MKKILALFCVVMLGMCLTAPAEAGLYDITLTGATGYRLYFGNPDSLDYIGKSVGDWTTAETFNNVNLNDGQYVYVMGWDIGAVEGILGQFNAQDANYNTFFTGKDGWTLIPFAIDQNTQLNNDAVMDAMFAAYVNVLAGSVYPWNPVDFSVVQGDPEYDGFLGSVDGSAEWMWGECCTEECTYKGFIFRHMITSTEIPEPATMMLFGFGLTGFAFIRKKKA